MSWKRHYEHPHAASIMRGSTGYDAPVYLPEFKHYNLSWLDLPGKSGLEAALNSKLSGTAGYEQVRLDVLAYRQEVIQSSPAQDGDDVTLTIDIALQQELEALLRSQHQAGAVVVMDLATSEVLAAVSEPSHPLGSESTPVQGSLLNRVLGGFYPPGSTLKPLVAIEALQLGLVTPEETIDCPGYFRLPDGRQVACNKRSGHGNLSLEAALAHSCNVYFCVLGDRLGDHFERVGEAVGLGALPGSELRQQEKNGIRFVPSWVRQTGRPRWTAGDSANASIGQGSWIVTPMQLLIALSAIVTGRRHQPTFIQGAYLQPAEKTDWDEEMLAQIRKGMLGCTEYGTGKTMRIPGHAVLAKTGTAEVGGAQKPHALAFAAVPAEAPRFACVCVIEHGGGGGKVAGPIVQKALLAAMARQ